MHILKLNLALKNTQMTLLNKNLTFKMREKIITKKKMNQQIQKEMTKLNQQVQINI